jgi:hypothetical protein
MQQWRKLREIGSNDPKPQQQTLDDLTEFLTPYEIVGNKRIVMINANDPITSTAMDSFIDGLNLCDLMADYLPATPPTTYQRGRDHIVGTMGVNLAMTHAYVLPFGTGDSPKSNHVIRGIDFSLDVLCGITPESLYHDPTHPAARQLWLTDVKAASRYVELVEQRCQADNIEKHVAKVVQSCQKTGIYSVGDEKILNDIDANITEITIWTENKCKWAKGRDWSPLLANEGRTVIAVKRNLSNIVHG